MVEELVALVGGEGRSGPPYVIFEMKTSGLRPDWNDGMEAARTV